MGGYKKVPQGFLEMAHKINKSLTYKGYFDGSAKPNPGHMHIGGYIEAPSKKIICKYSVPMGLGTNNEAEYLSLIKLISEINQHGICKVKIYGDSKIAINQVNRVWKAREPRMQVLRDRCLKELEKIDEWSLTHILRTRNSKADSLT
jgi:ribonuclease HI